MISGADGMGRGKFWSCLRLVIVLSCWFWSGMGLRRGHLEGREFRGPQPLDGLLGTVVLCGIPTQAILAAHMYERGTFPGSPALLRIGSASCA